MNLRPSGYEPDELPDCSTPHQVDGVDSTGRGGCQPGVGTNGSSRSVAELGAMERVSRWVWITAVAGLLGGAGGCGGERPAAPQTGDTSGGEGARAPEPSPAGRPPSGSTEASARSTGVTDVTYDAGPDFEVPALVEQPTKKQKR